MSKVSYIKSFLEPRSVAMIGVSRKTGAESFNILESIQHQGFKGKLYPVNPYADEILGIKVYSSIRDLPDGIELAVMVTPRKKASKIVKECAQKGIKAIVIVGQGFADATDQKGKNLQNEIVEIARQNNIRIVGPNTIGTANAFVDFTLSFAKQFALDKIPVGLISQSGLFFGQINELVMIGKGIDLGNGCDVDVADCLEYFATDPDIKVIALHIEGVKDGRKFVRAALSASRKKPVVVLKTGRQANAASAAQSHTGSIIGNDDIYDAAFKQCGLIRAETIDEMSDLVKLFSYTSEIKGRGIGIVTLSGGVGILTMDACEKNGLDVVKLSRQTKEKITNSAPKWLDIANPLDIWPAVMTSKLPLGEAFEKHLLTFMGDPKINAAIMILAAWMEKITPSLTEILVKVAKAHPEKPMILCPYEGWVYDVDRRDLEKKLHKTGKILVLPASDRAARALGHLAGYSESDRK